MLLAAYKANFAAHHTRQARPLWQAGTVAALQLERMQSCLPRFCLASAQTAVLATMCPSWCA